MVPECRVDRAGDEAASRVTQPPALPPLEMQMRCVRKPRVTHLGDDLTARDVLTREHVIGATMGIERGSTILVQHDDHITHSGDAIVAIHDEPTARRDDRVSFRRTDIDSIMPAMGKARIAGIAEAASRVTCRHGERQSVGGVEVADRHEPFVERPLMHDRHGRRAKAKAQVARESSGRTHRSRNQPLPLAIQAIAATCAALARHPHALARRLEGKPIRVAREPPLRDTLGENDATDAIDGLRFGS